jgi:hypothetical protein
MTTEDRSGADARMRAQVGGLAPGVDFAPAPRVAAPPLAQATVALVTTAALMHPGEPWPAGSHDFRYFSRDELDRFAGEAADGGNGHGCCRVAVSTPKFETTKGTMYVTADFT